MLTISIPLSKVPVLSPVTPITPNFNTPSLAFPQTEDKERIETHSAFLFRKVCESLDDAGSRAVVSLYRSLLEAGQKNNDGMVVVEGGKLKEVLEGKWDVRVTSEELDAVLSKFQTGDDDTTSIPIGDFVRSIKGNLHPQRLDMVRDVYRSILDSTGRDVVLLKDAKARYNTLAHPRVQSGELDPDRVLWEFVTYWNKDRPDGAIELIEWEVYYSTISVNIEADDYFEKLITQCWPGVKPSSQPPTKLNPQTRGALQTRINRLTFLISDPRTFRTCLDLCMLRHPPLSQRPFSHPTYLRAIVTEMFNCIHEELDEDAFGLLQKRMVKELGMSGFAIAGMAEMEATLRGALRKELAFLEYQIQAKTAKV